MAARIVGVGKYLPERVLTNHDLEKLVDTSDEWIYDRTGIRERRIAAPDEAAGTLGTRAALAALTASGVDPESIELVICATCSPDGLFPATASLIQDGVGARNAAAFDVNAACVGFVAALATATQFINAGVYRRALVVGSEVMSRVIDWKDRSTCVLFGDGAGAVVLEQADSGGARSFVLKNDGATAGLLYARGPASAPAAAADGYFLVMDGREVFRFAVRTMEEATRQAIYQAGLHVADLACVIPHQANQRIMSAVAKNLGLPPERMFSNVERYGNTSSASIPVALCEAWEQGLLRQGDNFAIVAFGAGLAWGASVIEWTGIGCEADAAEAIRTGDAVVT